MNGPDALKLVLVVGLIAFVLFRNLPGALLFFRPTLTKYRVRESADAMPEARYGVAVRDMLAELEGLGFTLLGQGAETRPLFPEIREIVLASESEHSFALVRPRADEAFLLFLAPFEDGSMLVSADHVFPPADAPGYQAGGLPGSTPTQLLNAHRRRVARTLEGGPKPTNLTLEERGRVLDRFYASPPGRSETRRRELRHAILAVGAIVGLGMLLNKLLAR